MNTIELMLEALNPPDGIDSDEYAQLVAKAIAAGEAELKREPVAQFNWNLGGFEWLTKYNFVAHHRKPLYTREEIK